MEQEVSSLLVELITGGVKISSQSVVLIVTAVAVVSFLATYLAAKAKGLATKEDIEEITRKIESVRTSFSKELEDYMQRNRLAMAALERRLQAYQEAFSWWHDLMSHANRGGEEFDRIAQFGQEWLKNNSLYLDADAREKLYAAIIEASLRPQLLEIQDNTEDRKKNWELICEAGDALIRGAGLPGFTEQELDAREESEE